MYGRTGEKHPFFDKRHTEETKAFMSEVRKGKSHSIEVKAKMSETHKGKTLTAETRAKISKALSGKTGENYPASKKVFVYTDSTPAILSHEFISYSEAAKYFNCSIMTISRYTKNGKLFQDKWILTLSTKE